MISDQLSNQAIYRSVQPGIERAFDYLLDFAPNTPDGKYSLDGDNVFALVQSYKTVGVELKKFESHRDYVDLQYVVDGEEIIYHSPIALLPVMNPYDANKDCTLYNGEHDQALAMRPGSFTVLFPHDGHKPGCIYGTARLIKKVVLKIRTT